MEMAVWPVWRAGTATPSGCNLNPELTLTRGLSDRVGIPMYKLFLARARRAKFGTSKSGSR
eukprot:2644861-Alexandrium_andersonii.AAC.1